MKVYGMNEKEVEEELSRIEKEDTINEININEDEDI